MPDIISGITISPNTTYTPGAPPSALSTLVPSDAVVLTPTVTASSAYSAGNIVGGLLTFPSVFRVNTGVITSIYINVKSTQSNAYKLYFFTSNPSNSTWTDKAAPAIASTDVFKVVGPFNLATYDSGLGTGTFYVLSGIGQQFTSSSATLYALLVTTAAVTYASSTDVQIGVGVLQD